MLRIQSKSNGVGIRSLRVPLLAAILMAGGVPSQVSSADDPVPRGLRSMLILDRQSVAEGEGVTFHLNPAQKHPENPVLLPGRPSQWDGLQVSWPGTVLYDDEDKLYRCWYSGLDPVQKNRPPHWVPGYAESRDGIHWTKPDLGQAEHDGDPTNRVMFNGGQVNSLVMKNPDPSDPQRRFLGFFIGSSEGRMTKNLGSSPDGKTWLDEGVAYLPPTPNRTDYLDISQVILQPDAKDPHDRVLAYAQVAVGPTYIRKIGMLRGPDIRSLKMVGESSEDSVILDSEPGIDEELHFASVKKFGETYIMLFESDRFTENHGDLRVAVSEDGRHFRRIHPEQPLVPHGPRGMWDANMIVTTSDTMQVVGDEIQIFYFGTPVVYTDWPGQFAKRAELRGSFFYPCCLGLATLPVDRFAFASGPGSLTTLPLVLGSEGLWLNAEGDNIHVEALDATGKRIAEGLVSGPGGLYRQVHWNGLPPTGEVGARIMLESNQKLFSLKY